MPQRGGWKLSMKLVINENDLNLFKKRASRGYPREVYGIMLGKRLANRTYKIVRIVIPPVVEATNCSIGS